MTQHFGTQSMEWEDELASFLKDAAHTPPGGLVKIVKKWLAETDGLLKVARAVYSAEGEALSRLRTAVLCSLCTGPENEASLILDSEVVAALASSYDTWRIVPALLIDPPQKGVQPGDGVAEVVNAGRRDANAGRKTFGMQK